MQSNGSVRLANLRILQFVATKLGSIRDDFVFLGGCTTGLFVDDPDFYDVRYTLDVDCIVDVISLNQYHLLEKKLTKQGFKRSLTESVICRWFHDDVILDVMPTDEKILGFSNRWYKNAIKYAVNYNLSNDLQIKIITAPYFLATKLEAFKTRGKMDFYASQDFEDIVSVLDGRLKIADEIAQSDNELRDYLVESFVDIDNSNAFRGAILGHFVQYGNLAESRAGMLEKKIKTIIQE